MRELICGKNSVIEALKNKLALKVIYTSKPHELSFVKNVEIKHVDKKFLDHLTKENHQGFVARLVQLPFYDLATVIKNRPDQVLVLDHIQDPHNLGAILRSANAFGLNYIIMPKDRAAQISSSVLKVASGGQINLKIIRVKSLVDAIIKLKKAHFWIYASSLANATSIKKINLNKPSVLIVGNEAKGISQTLLKQADQKIYIPMKGSVQSLNVSVAAAILMFYFSE